MTKIILAGAMAGVLALTLTPITVEDAKSENAEGIVADGPVFDIVQRKALAERRASRAAKEKADRLEKDRLAKVKAAKEKPAEAKAFRPKPKAVKPTSKPSAKHRPKGSWLALAKCESGATLTKNTGNGYYGAYQFSAQSWKGFTHGRFGPVLEAGWPVQTYVAYRIWLKQGWGAFPGCGKKLGYPNMPKVSAP